MDPRPGLLSVLNLRRIFGGSDAVLERRVRELPVMMERRAGPRCADCGFGTLHAVPDGQANAGMLRCDRPGCGHVSEKPAGAPQA